MNLDDLIKLNYLNMFMVKPDSYKVIRRIFTCQMDHISKHLSKLCLQDLLLGFFYFSYSLLIFQKHAVLQCPPVVNQNMVKLFLRHFPKMANELHYDLKSEPEDHDNSKEVKVKKDFKVSQDLLSNRQLMQQVNVFEGNSVTLHGMDVDEHFPSLEADTGK